MLLQEALELLLVVNILVTSILKCAVKMGWLM